MPLQGEEPPVGLLGDEPTARLQSAHHAVEGGDRIGQVHQEEPRMHEVEGVGFDDVLGDVVPAYLDVRRHIVEKAGVEIAGDDAAGWPDLAGQPPGDRTCAGTNLEAPPSRTDADLAKAADRVGVGPGLEKLQPSPFGVVGNLAEDVLAGGRAVGQPANSRTSRATSAGFSSTRRWAASSMSTRRASGISAA